VILTGRRLPPRAQHKRQACCRVRIVTGGMNDPVAAPAKQTGNVEGDDAMPDEADSSDDGGFSDPGV
jgi:hypothetical protein